MHFVLEISQTWNQEVIVLYILQREISQVILEIINQLYLCAVPYIAVNIELMKRFFFI